MDINVDKLELCGNYFFKNGLKVCLAESMTAGYLASIISLERNAGDYFLGSIVCYHDDMKIKALQVDPQLLKIYGGVSSEVTREITNGLLHIFKPDIAIGITGFAFECSQTSFEKPVGTVYIHIIFNSFTTLKVCRFSGTAEEIIKSTCNEVIEILFERIQLINSYDKCKL